MTCRFLAWSLMRKLTEKLEIKKKKKIHLKLKFGMGVKGRGRMVNGHFHHLIYV